MKGVIHQQFSVVWSRILASVRRYYDRQKKIPQTSDTWWGDCRRREVFRLRRKTSLLRIPVVQSALLSRARVVDGEGDLMNPQGREASACSPANWYGVRGSPWGSGLNKVKANSRTAMAAMESHIRGSGSTSSWTLKELHHSIRKSMWHTSHHKLAGTDSENQKCGAMRWRWWTYRHHKLNVLCSVHQAYNFNSVLNKPST